VAARTAQAVQRRLVPKASRRSRTRPAVSSCKACGGTGLPQSRAVSCWATHASRRSSGLRPLRVSNPKASTPVPASTSIAVGMSCWIRLTRPRWAA